MRANTGWSSVSPIGEPVNQGLLRLLPTAQPFNQGVAFHTWVHEDPAPLYKPLNLIRRRKWTATGSCEVNHPTCSPLAAECTSGEFNGVAISTISKIPNQGCIVTFAEFDLASNPVVRGQALYLLIQANISHAHSGISLLVDNGSGDWKYSSDSDTSMGWAAHSYQMTMGVHGKARVGLQVHSSYGSSTVVELGSVVMAPIGQEWTRL